MIALVIGMILVGNCLQRFQTHLKRIVPNDEKFTFVLSLLPVLRLMVGCAGDLASSAEEKIDHLKNRAEAYLDGKKDRVGQYMESAT